MFVAENFGLIDVIFLKGNALGGVNGATDADSARDVRRASSPGPCPTPSPHLDTGDGTPADRRGRITDRPRNHSIVRPYPTGRSVDGTPADRRSPSEPLPDPRPTAMGEKLTRTQQKNLERLGGVNPAEQPIPRRQFLTQVGLGVAAVGAAAGVGVAITDPWGMKGVEPPPPVRLKDYSIALPPSRPSLVVVRSAPPTASSFADADALYAAREEQALHDGPLGPGRDGGRRAVHPEGATWSSSSPTSPSTRTRTSAPRPSPTPSRPSSSSASAAGARKVIVCDNPINNPESCFYKTRVGDAAQRAGATLMLPKSSYFEQLYDRRRDDQGHLEHVLRPLPRGDQGHRRQPGEGPQPLQGDRLA